MPLRGELLAAPLTRPKQLRGATEARCAGASYGGNSTWCALLDFGRLQRQNPKMTDESSQRIDRLESHLAHLEHQVEQLNGVVIEQGKLLDRLSKETQRQSGAMQTLELERMKSNAQKPPHYQ
jgi:SlyX protein